MKAIQKLRRVGYTLQEIAEGAEIGVPALAMYRRGDRFPKRRTFVCFVEMAEARGLTLLARDFITEGDRCENGEGANG